MRNYTDYEIGVFVKLWFDAVFRSLEKIPSQLKFELGQVCYLCSKRVGGDGDDNEVSTPVETDRSFWFRLMANSKKRCSRT
jgi:hypothetical protein